MATTWPRERRRSRILAASLLSCALAGGVAAHAAPTTRKVTAIPMRGSPVEGELTAISETAVTISGRPEPLPVDALREVRFSPDGPNLPVSSGTWVRATLRGGETVRGAVTKGSEDWIEVTPPDFPAVRLPFDSIRRIENESEFASPCSEPATGKPARKGSDVAYVRSGDAVPGTLASVSPEGVVIDQAGGRKANVSWADLVVLHVDEPPLDAPKGLTAEIDTVGGSRLTAASVTGSATSLQVKTRAGIAIELPAEAVRVVRWSGGKFAWASDLAFQSEFTNYREDDTYDPAYPEAWYGTRADRTKDGCPLRVGGLTFRHGFAVHSKTVLKVPLNKAFTSFDGRFGIDDKVVTPGASRKGDVVARVLADGKEVWSSGGSVKGGEASRAVGPIDVTGVTELVLEVGFGGDGNYLDSADWVDPLLIRASGS
jgi:hypothetical protein